MLSYLLLEILMQHPLVLLDDGHEVHGHDAARPVFQQLLHRLQGSRGVLPVLAHFLQIAFQHVQHVHRVIIVLFIHMLFLVLHIGPDVTYKAFRQFGEVDDVVQRVEDTVYESLRQFAGRRHLLQSHDLRRAFLHDFLQPVLLFP